LCATAILGLFLWAALEYGGLRYEILYYARAVVRYDAREVRFGVLDGASPLNPTALRFGPEGRLYVGEQNGRILAYTIDRLGSGAYRASNLEIIEGLLDIPNHDDDGSLAPLLKQRLLTGLIATGTAERPVLYAVSSDPRLLNEKADTNSGIISRLGWDGYSWVRDDLVRGLPRSHNDHAPNGLWLDEEERLLYVTVGSNTNCGAPSRYFRMLPEYALSAAILEIDLKSLPDTPYDLPTLDDEDRPGREDENDPFGGNAGKNQAVLPVDGPVSLYASGLRNPYRLAEVDGDFYTVDNGPNQNVGGPPVWKDGRVTNEPSEAGEQLPNALLRIPSRGFYGGHPNPTRADRRNTFNESNPQSPVAESRPIEADWLPPGEKDGEVMSFRASLNGIAVYRSTALGPEWNGCLMIAGWDRMFRLVCVSEKGGITADRIIVRRGGHTPLDLTAQPDDGPFPGSIWATDHATNVITFVEPVTESGPSQAVSVAKRDVLVWAAELADRWLKM
jgi:hypothetical protein